jgi:dihydropteroate synthase
MHMHLEPQSMQMQPMAGDVLPQVLSFLERSAHDLQALEVNKNRIVIDPGIGFGKTAEQNFLLLKHQSELATLGYALLVGWSRKSSLSAMTATASQSGMLAANERLIPSVAAALLAARSGAHVLRVHDVRETVQALRVLNAIG